MAYSVRGTNNFGYSAGAYYSNDNYGRVVEGNAQDSYGPWIDPELQRVPHRFGRRHRLNRRHQPAMNGYGQMMF